MGEANWGKVRQTLTIIEDARREGFDVTCDVYPYPRAGVGSLADRLMSYTELDDPEEFLKDFTDPVKFPKLRRQMEEKVKSQRKADEARRKALKAAGVSSRSSRFPDTLWLYIQRPIQSSWT